MHKVVHAGQLRMMKQKGGKLEIVYGNSPDHHKWWPSFTYPMSNLVGNSDKALTSL